MPTHGQGIGYWVTKRRKVKFNIRRWMWDVRSGMFARSGVDVR